MSSIDKKVYRVQHYHKFCQKKMEITINIK